MNQEKIRHIGERKYEVNMAKALTRTDKELQDKWLEHNNVTICPAQKLMFVELPISVIAIPINKKE